MKWWPEKKEYRAWWILGISLVGITLAICGIFWVVANMMAPSNLGSTIAGWVIFLTGIVICAITNKLRKK